MEIMTLGNLLLYAAAFFLVLTFGMAAAAAATHSRRLTAAARRSSYAVLLIVGASTACMMYGYAAGLYDVKGIYEHSERFLPAIYKLAGIWAGLSGSLLFWTFLLCAFWGIASLRFPRHEHAAAPRRIEPYVHLVLSLITLFFVLATRSEHPFEPMELAQKLNLAKIHGVGISEAGRLQDGVGLNQQLVNYWFLIHPPTLYMGYVAWAIPFAIGIAGLLARETGEYWLRTVRIWSLASWILLTAGIVLGGLWAYRQLGWGGYWAWDAVENASLIPWLTGTAFIHSLVVMQRRDTLKRWSLFLLSLTFFLTIVGTWMTRSGVVNSVHSFAGGTIGIWFQVFLFIIAAGSVFVLAFRFQYLRGSGRIESLLSREAAFYIGNFFLVLIALVVFGLSFLPKISHDWFASMRTDQDGGIFNRVVTPFFLLLLLVTATGPLLRWGPTRLKDFWKAFRGPFVATVVFLLLVYAFFIKQGLAGDWKEVLLPRLSAQHPTALYPTGIVLALSFFILATAGADLLRAVLSRKRNRGERTMTALVRTLGRANRHYGGSLVHVGLAVLAVGIIVSSMFKVKEELLLKVGEWAPVGPYVVSPVSRSVRENPVPGEPYAKVKVLFRVAEAGSESLLAASLVPGGPRRRGRIVKDLEAERRFYPKKQEWISEVSIHRKPLEDIYVYFRGQDRSGKIAFAVHLNPFMFFIYAGWIIMTIGGLFAALPLDRRRQVKTPGESAARQETEKDS